VFRDLLLKGIESPFLLLCNVRVRTLVSGPLSFKAAVPPESKVLCALGLHNESLPFKAAGQSGR
jgi:hypothetical protein